jgi:glycosyltransferase involved in cell wall biosynthesis
VTVAVRKDAPRLADEVRDAGGKVIPLLPHSAPSRHKLPEIYFWLPLQSRGWQCYYSLDHKLPAKTLLPGYRVATVHDICPLEFPQEYGRLKRFYFGLQLPNVLRTASCIATVSDHTAHKLVKTLHADRARIMVSPNGFDTTQFSAQAGPNEAAQLFEAYGLKPKTYHLFVGRLSPRKNLSLVIEAARQLKERGGEPRVVVAGPKGWRDEGDWARIQEYGLTENFRRIAFVPSELLPVLYRQSRGLLYPSFSEGFGIPVLESLACGSPVVVASGTSCAEIGGPLVDVINPHDVEAMAQWMQHDHGLDETARRDWLAQFSWEKTAEGIASMLAPSLSALRAQS